MQAHSVKRLLLCENKKGFGTEILCKEVLVYVVQGVLTLHDFHVLAKSCKVKIVLSESGLKLSQDSLNADF